MTIERISFPNGLPIADAAQFDPIKFAIENISEAKPLPVGEHDLTPNVWKKNVYKYNLLVDPDGTCVLRLVPRYVDSQSQVISSEGETPLRKGGRSIAIPQDQNSFAIVGPKRNDPQIYLFEFLIHHPGPSPVPQESEVVLRETANTSEVVTEEVTNIHQAKKLIVEDAKRRVLALDWSRFGISDLTEIGEYFEALYPLILRQAPIKFALNLLDESKPREKAWLDQIAFDHRTILVDRYWLVMLKDSIEPQEATLIRDWLWMKAPEAIAGLKDLSPLAVVAHFMSAHSDFNEAGVRTLRLFEVNP